MTAGIRVHVVMPPELVERIDSQRNEGQSRADWVRRAVERALGDASDVPGSSAPLAPAEQPEPIPGQTTVDEMLEPPVLDFEQFPAAEHPPLMTRDRSAREVTVDVIDPKGNKATGTVETDPHGRPITSTFKPSGRRHLPNCKCPVCS